MDALLRRITLLAVIATAVTAGFAPGVAHAAEVSVRDFGAVGDGSTDDSAAVQRANDAVAKAGGGRVLFPAGTYIVRRVFMDSYVEFSGTGGAVLKHPDGYSSAIIYARTRGTTGSISAGSRSLRVASAVGIRPGVPVAIRGAGRRIAGQTTAYPYHYSYVSSVSGSTITIARSAVSSVTNAEVHTGSTNIAIKGLTLDGNQPTEGALSAAVPIDLRLTRRAVISGCVIRNGFNGGIRLDLGSVENRIEQNQIVDTGRPAQRFGSAIWLFRGAGANTVRNNTITGTHYFGIAIDDRSEDATDWDAPSDSNWITGNTITTAPVDWNVAIYIGGSSNNKVEYNTASTVQSGVLVMLSTQGENGRDAQNNRVTGNVLTDHKMGIGVTGSQNVFSSNRISGTSLPYLNLGSGNTYSP